MWYGIGIDLGTSFTAAAVNGPEGTRMVPLAPEVIVPSVAYPAPNGSLLVGPAALASAPDPARVARNFKRRLGDPTPLVLGGSAYSPATLMAAQLREVIAVATANAGGPPASVVLTCPAIWGPYRREHFTEVPRLAGLADVQLLTEPEAAATHYSSERRLGDGEVVAVYDLGGGTFDTTILRMRAGRMEILGTPEGIEHLGGIDFDETLLAHLDERLDGAIGALDPADPAASRALGAIRAICVRAKEDLSTEPDVELSVPLPSGPRAVTITRREFNDMIRPSVQLTADALHRTTTSAGLRADDLSAVLLAGGSSRIPLVEQVVSQEFGKPVRVTLHPKYTVALGAAAIAARPRASSPAPRPPIPAQPAAPTAPGAAPRRRKTWLVSSIAAAVVVLLAVATTLVLVNRGEGTAQAGDETPTPTTTTVATEEPEVQAAPPNSPLQVFDGHAVDPYVGLIASAVNWGGSKITAEGAEQSPTIIARPTEDADGLHVSWAGDGPAQFYLQTVSGTQDLQSYVDSEGALVFDVTVQEAPTDGTTLAVHCVYPCGAEVAATNVFQQLPKGEPSTVKIPLACFASAGLDPKHVNTPFLVYAETRFEATFTNVRWESGAANDDDSTPCADLH